MAIRGICDVSIGICNDLDMKNKKISIIPWGLRCQGIIDTKIIILFYIDTIAKILHRYNR